MIKTSMQLKDKIRNLSGGDSMKALVLIRNYMMERFLERVSKSNYKSNFILKGGMLVSAMVGLEFRSTMDIDTTLNSVYLSLGNVERIMNEIIAVDVLDGVSFSISKMSRIMDEHDYPGIRVFLDACFEKLRQTVKIDISTGDIITLGAVEYSYNLMFENRSIKLLTYNIETLLAEKLETVMSRATANTRMRDFYDIHVVSNEKEFDVAVLGKAFLSTCKARNSVVLISRLDLILDEIASDETMNHMWNTYRSNNPYVGLIGWDDVNKSVRILINLMVPL